MLAFPHLFFPASDPTSAVLQSFATFSIAFFARPLGAAVFGHFGDRIGRKAVIWVSILGAAPFALLLPHANLLWCAVLTVIIGVVLAILARRSTATKA